MVHIYPLYKMPTLCKPLQCSFNFDFMSPLSTHQYTYLSLAPECTFISDIIVFGSTRSLSTIINSLPKIFKWLHGSHTPVCIRIKNFSTTCALIYMKKNNFTTSSSFLGSYTFQDCFRLPICL